MLDIVRHYDALVEAQIGILRRTLTAISDAELDWCPHPQANPIRWILAHHLWYEAWVPNVIDAAHGASSERRLADPDVVSAEDFWARFEPLVERRRWRYARLSDADLTRPVDYLGAPGYTVGRLVRTHAAHFTGHTWQVKYVRGAYSRAFGTDKRVFDPM